MPELERHDVTQALAALTGGDATNHLGAIGDGLFGMKRTLASGKALADYFGVLIDENGHGISFPSPL